MSLRLGVVGSGGMGASRMNSFASLPGCELAALALKNPETSGRLARQHGVELYSDWHDLLDRDDVDAVLAMTYNDSHGPISIAALEAGKHAFRAPGLGGLLLAVALSLAGGLVNPSAASEPDDPLPWYTLAETRVSGTRDQAPTIATRLALPLKSTPASVGVVPRSLIQTQGGRTLSDALRNVSGVNVQSGFGVFDFFLIRGFDSLSNGLILTDGAPEPEVAFYQMYNVEQVEVLKGPGAFLYGGNPLSGTVNLRRKRPIFERFVHATGSAGRFQSYRGSVDAGTGSRETGRAYRLNGQWHASDGYRDDKDSESFNINPAMLWRMGDNSVSLNAEYAASEHHTDSGLPVFGSELVDVPRTRSYQSPFDLSDQKAYRLRVDYERPLGARVRLRDKVYFTQLDWKSTGTLFLFDPAFDQEGGVPLGRTLTLLDDRQRLVGNQLEAVLEFNTGLVDHRLLAGVELSRLTDDYTLEWAELPPMDLFEPQETAEKPLHWNPNQAGEATSTTVSSYVVDHLRLSEFYQVLVGGRVDAIDHEDAEIGNKQKFNRFSPMLGILYSPSPPLNLYANAGRAFAPPSSLGRGDRKAEESEQVEVGARIELAGGRLEASVAIYQLDKDVASDNGVTRLAGEQRSRGVELDLMLDPGYGWQGHLGFAFTAAELRRFEERNQGQLSDGTFFEKTSDRSGNEPAFAPAHLFSVWLAKELPRRVHLGVGARYVGDQFIAQDNAFTVDGALTFDAALTYRQGPGMLRLNLKNLSDAEYETRGFSTTSVIPAAPRTLEASVEWSW